MKNFIQILITFSLLNVCCQVADMEELQCFSTLNDIKSGHYSSTNVWSVQFMINSLEVDSIINALKIGGNCELIHDFENHRISSEDVHSYESKMVLFDDTLKIGKMTHEDWEKSLFSFDWKESVKQAKIDSKILKIEELLNSAKLDYALANYGVFGE